jgi:23S rRNA pseudouridine1911/1915/1917 synthase
MSLIEPSVDHTEEREQLRIVVPPGEHRKRLDVYLTHRVENATRNKVQQAIETGMVLVNSKVRKSSYLLNPNDIIDITFPRPPRMAAEPEDIPLDILFEDASLLIINKPAGMVTHPAYGNYSGTLVNALLHHCNHLSTINTEMRPGIVHRLDKDTTGLMVVAKTDTAHSFLAKQFAQRSIDREYWAIVWGRFKSPKGTIEANLGRSKRDRKKVAVIEDGKSAITEYEVLKEFDFLSLVRLHLKTGRTHQIRVHLAHINHPVFGDATYGGRNATWNGLAEKKEQRAATLLKLLSRQALHAKTIGFIHPVTKEFLKFNSELPADMQAILEKI